MSPEERKAASHAKLKPLGVAINEHLPLIESDEEVQLRSNDELLRRLVALWAVVGTAVLRGSAQFCEYITAQGLESWLSNQEREFMRSKQPAEQQFIRFSWQLEALYFLAWCAGLIEQIEIPSHESSVDSILALFPRGNEPPERLRAAIRVRAKNEVLGWADLLYRLHWAVRDAQLRGSTIPTTFSGGVVQEWHRAVNWMTRYEEEDDWDHVATDT